MNDCAVSPSTGKFVLQSIHWYVAPVKFAVKTPAFTFTETSTASKIVKLVVTVLSQPFAAVKMSV